MKIGIVELLVIFIVALFAVGPDKLPSYARKLGEALAQFKKYSEEATKDIKESIVEPLEAAQKPLRDAVEPLEEIDRSVRGSVKEVKDSFSGIGKSKPKKPELEKQPPEPPRQGSAQEEPAASEGGAEAGAPPLEAEPGEKNETAGEKED